MNKCLFFAATVILTALASLPQTMVMAATPAPTPACVSRMCLDNDVPVCGSNLKSFKTYSNSCELNNAKCKDAALVLAYLGECTPEASATWVPPTPALTPAPVPPIPATAVPTLAPTACTKKQCPSVYRPVCGSDGVVYPSACDLNNAKCDKPTLKTNATCTIDDL